MGQATGDERAAKLDEMHRAIGSAITAWARVEGAMARLLAACLGPADCPTAGVAMLYESGIAFAAFYAVDQFRSKLSLVNAVVLQRFNADSDEFGGWSKLGKKAGDLSLRRNRLAHWDAVFMSVEGREVPVLAPQSYSPQYVDYAFGSKRPLTAHDVDQLRKAFTLLAGKIDALCVDVIKSQALQAHWPNVLEAQRHNQENYVITRESGRGINFPLD